MTVVRRLLFFVAAVLLPWPLLLPAATVTSGTNVQSGTQAPLYQGTICFGGSCTSVSNGSFGPYNVSAGTYTVTVQDNLSRTILTLNGVLLSDGVPWVFDQYSLPPVVPPAVSGSGLGSPYLPCSPGAVYTQSNPVDPTFPQWVCQRSSGGQFQWANTNSTAGSGSASQPIGTVGGGSGPSNMPCAAANRQQLWTDWAGKLQYVCNGSAWVLLPIGTGSGTVNAGGNRSLPSYPSGAGGPSVSPINVTTDAAGNNMNVPGTGSYGGPLTLSDNALAISQNAAPVPTSSLGIISNGVTDNAAAVSAAFNQASAGTTPSLIFPPGATTLVAGPIFITSPNHNALQPPSIDLNGGTLEFTGEGNDIVAVQYTHAYTAGQVVVGAGYNQKVEAACTSGASDPTWGTNPFVSVTTWGTCSLDNFGENSETWHPSEFVGYGRQVSDGTYLEFATQTGTSGASTPTWAAIGSTVTDGGTIWLNTGILIPASKTWQCDQGVNGLLRISNGARFSIRNGTIKMDSLTAPCLLNWSPQDFSRTAFNTALVLQNVTLAQSLPADTSVRTLSTAFYINRAALLHSDNMNFYGNFGVKISLGDGAAQDYATDENDVNTFSNTYLWDLARQYPLAARSTAYTTGQLLRGSNLVVQVQAACTTASTAPTWSNTPGTVITDGSCSLTTLNISAALFFEIAVNTPQAVAFNNTYIEVGPGFNLQSTQSNGNVELNGGWIGDGNPGFGIRAESSTFSIHNFFIYNFLTGADSFGTGIYAHPGRSGSVFNNSLSNQVTALDLGNSVQTFGNVLSTSNTSGIPVAVNGQFNTISSNTLSSASATSINLAAANNSLTFNRFITGVINCAVQGNTILSRSVDTNANCALTTNNIIGTSTSYFNRLSPGFQQNVQTGFTSYTPSLTQVNGVLYGWNAGASDNGMSGLVAGGQATLSSQVGCVAESSLTQRDFGCWFGATKKWFVNANGENMVQLASDPVHVLGQFYYQSTVARLTLDDATSYNRLAYLTDLTALSSGLFKAVHLGGSGTAPTVAIGSQATAASLDATANDTGGTVTVTAVAVPVAGTVFTLTFGTPYGTAPHCNINQNGGTAYFGASRTTSTTALVVSTAVAITTGTDVFTYLCFQ